MARSLLLVAGSALLLSAGCAASPPTPVSVQAVGQPAPPWKRPDMQAQLKNLWNARVPFMTGDHTDSPMHKHVKLEIFYNGQPVKVPAEVGIVNGAMAEMHTHDDWGLIHIEGDKERPYTLGQFFDVWGVSLDGARVFFRGRLLANPRAMKLADGQAFKIYYTTPR